MAGPGRRFAHPSEGAFADLLDFYGVAWEYEPRTFVLDRDDQGRATRAFRPDFYLPEHDVFIELTTLRQKLVTKKNAKLRRLRELYPEVRVKVIYQRDYRSLLDKYHLAGDGGESQAATAAPQKAAVASGQ